MTTDLDTWMEKFNLDVIPPCENLYSGSQGHTQMTTSHLIVWLITDRPLKVRQGDTLSSLRWDDVIGI
jgi:hypothetical protein